MLEVSGNYTNLKTDFQQSDVNIKVKNIKWRDDMQFLYELGNAYRYYKEHGIFPFITYKTLPILGNARWSSRAIYPLFAFVLLPEKHELLNEICELICRAWFDVWFSVHFYKEDNYENLDNSLKKHKKCTPFLINIGIKTVERFKHK